MKDNSARTTWILTFSFVWFTFLAAVSASIAGDYYIYHDQTGKFVISNSTRPTGSTIIKKETFRK